MKGSFWVWFGAIWLAVGLPFVLIAAFLVVDERRFETEGRLVEAMVLTKEIRHVTYRFDTPDHQRFEGHGDVPEATWNALTERGPIQVVYLRDRPASNRIAGESKRMLLALFAFLGGFLSLVGGTMLVGALRSARTKRRLLESGVRAAAIVAEVGAMNLRVNGRTQWRLKYDYHDYQNRPHRGTVYLAEDTARQWKAGDPGNVMFDPERPQKAIWLGKTEEKFS